MKRKVFTALALAVTTAGCATSPVSMSRVVAPEAPDAFSCAIAQLNIMGYQLEDANNDARFVRGRKQASGFGRRLLLGATYHDIVTVTAFENPASGQTTLRVVVSRIEEQDGIGGLFGFSGRSGEHSSKPSDEGIADGDAVLDSCAGPMGAG